MNIGSPQAPESNLECAYYQKSDTPLSRTTENNSLLVFFSRGLSHLAVQQLSTRSDMQQLCAIIAAVIGALVVAHAGRCKILSLHHPRILISKSVCFSLRYLVASQDQPLAAQNAT
jgi:hypothetical protein